MIAKFLQSVFQSGKVSNVHPDGAQVYEGDLQCPGPSPQLQVVQVLNRHPGRLRVRECRQVASGTGTKQPQ